MKKILVRGVPVFLLVFTLAPFGWSQTSAPAEDYLNARFSKALGTDVNKIIQHYYLVKNGGVIEFTAKDPNDSASIVAVQKYLETQKDLFERGKNDGDPDAQGRPPDGIALLKKLRNEINFYTVRNDNGAVLRMFSINDQARQAIQTFMKFQITEHNTGDPLVAEE